MKRIVVANPNLAVDRTFEQDELVPGQVHRSTREVAVGGGKGANVARALARMGTDAVLVAMAGGPTGRNALDLLENEGIETVHTAHRGDTRSCLTVLVPGEVTVFNGSGPQIDRDEWLAFEDAFVSRLSSDTVAACSGSLPPGSPDDAVARLVRRSRDAEAWLVCDSSQGQLRLAVEAGAELVTPNLSEAEALLRGTGPEAVTEGSDALSRAARSARGLVTRGAGTALVTAGSAGAALASSSGTTLFDAPKVTVVNPIGAGDSLVAGILLGVARGESLSEAIALGIAMGSASCETFYAGNLDPKRAAELIQPPM